ncbi:uncharacterized protein LOC110848122 isoform X2 [Folsomia candida]|uniref:Uncharacterized protein n=1 Tax=Folsomia candida TaxID=158441 RepID=A0A226ECX8_FOLCA|nr:uncharacterized protein LOC110848122 isoform X2 [Folsomia candida]OXA55309.1 hypothetical protein Fcan01_09158 [Folsomia candida]
MIPFVIFLVVVLVGGAGAQQNVHDPRFIGQVPEQCGEDPSFCYIYCRSIDPDTTKARCARDLVSCICTNKRNNSIGVRFVQERLPQPSTTTTTTPLPPINFDYAPGEPVPVLLECDGSTEAGEICHEFCTLEVHALSGSCDLADKTCRCEGVSPSTMQPAPIAWIYAPRPTLPPPPTTPATPPPPLLMQQNYWNPITYGHPNYNYNPIPMQHPNGGYYMPALAPGVAQQQMYPPQLQAWDPYHTVTNEQWINPYQPQQPPLPPPASPSESTNQHRLEEIETTTMTPLSVETSTSEVLTSTSTSVSMTEGVEVMEEEESGQDDTAPQPERKKRSAASSYASAFSFGSGNSNRETCSVSTCQASCEASGFDARKRCIPKCVDTECFCLCKPERVNSSSFLSTLIDGKVEELVGQVLATPGSGSNNPVTGTTNYQRPVQGVPQNPSSPHPSTGLGGLTYGVNKTPLTQDEFMALFAPPPTLYT